MSDVEWGQAVPIPPEGRKDALDEQRSFAKMVDSVRAVGRRWCYWISGTSNLSTTIAVSALGLVIWREKPQPPQFIVLDRTQSGMAYDAIPAKDAVKLFDSSMRTDDVEKYIANRIGYSDVDDKEQWAVVRAMSSTACWTEYEAWRKSPLSPKQMLNTNGRVYLSEWLDDPHPMHTPDGAWTYTISVKSQQVKGRDMQMGRTPYRITVTFNYQPDMTMNPDDRHRNRRGFQCLSWRQDQL